MPLPAPLPPHVRARVVQLICEGHGRNETARMMGVSVGVVSKIARENNLAFQREVPAATRARRIDAWAAREAKREELEDQYTELVMAGRHRQARKVEVALRRLDRNHNGTYHRALRATDPS